MGPDAGLLILQDDRVPHLGWPVALVVAESPEQARAGAEALVVTYDEEPHDVTFAAGHPRAYFEEGRHRRVYPKLVVHLVFDDMSELRLGPDTAVGRSLGHMAGWLFER